MELTLGQEKQCRQTTIPLHFRGKDTFRPDRMSEAFSISALCGQEVGLPRDHVTAGREPGSPDIGDQFSAEVRLSVS